MGVRSERGHDMPMLTSEYFSSSCALELYSFSYNGINLRAHDSIFASRDFELYIPVRLVSFVNSDSLSVLIKSQLTWIIAACHCSGVAAGESGVIQKIQSFAAGR